MKSETENSIKLTVYHSYEWSILAESGYVTATVDNKGIAIMIKQEVKTND